MIDGRLMIWAEARPIVIVSLSYWKSNKIEKAALTKNSTHASKQHCISTLQNNNNNNDN